MSKTHNNTRANNSPNEVGESFVLKFNNDLLRAKESTYKTKNARLFTWGQTYNYQTKLPIPAHLKQSESFINTTFKDVKDDSLQTAALEVSKINPPQTNQLLSPKVPETELNSSRTVKSKKNKLLDFCATVGTFKSPEVSARGYKTQNGFFVTQTEKKSSYSVSRLQMSLLHQRETPVLEDVPNSQFMANQFDRRNYTLNRIIGQIKTRDEFLDLSEVKEETVRKLKYVARNIQPSKPHRKLKSSTVVNVNGNGVSRLDVLASPKHSRAPEPKFFSDPKIALEKVSDKLTIDSRYNTSPKSKQMRSPQNLQHLTIINPKPAIEQFSFREEVNPVYRIIDKTELIQVKQRAKKAAEKRKPNPNGLFHSVDNGLKDFEFIKERKINSPENSRRSRNSPILTIFQSNPDISVAKPSLADEREDEIRNVGSIGLVKPMSRARHGGNEDDDNIFNYGQYFKKNYMERGVQFEISRDLKSRIEELGKEVRESVRKMQTAH